jgi:allantoinase
MSGISSAGFLLQSVWTTIKKTVERRSRPYEHYIVRLSKWLSSKPAEILGIEEFRGAIAVGKLADIIVWQPERFASQKSMSLYPSMNPYITRHNFGAIKTVYLRGKPAYENGKFMEAGGTRVRTLFTK